MATSMQTKREWEIENWNVNRSLKLNFMLYQTIYKADFHVTTFMSIESRSTVQSTLLQCTWYFMKSGNGTFPFNLVQLALPTSIHWIQFILFASYSFASFFPTKIVLSFQHAFMEWNVLTNKWGKLLVRWKIKN